MRCLRHVADQAFRAPTPIRCSIDSTPPHPPQRPASAGVFFCPTVQRHASPIGYNDDTH